MLPERCTPEVQQTVGARGVCMHFKYQWMQKYTFILTFPAFCTSRGSCCFQTAQRAVLFPCFTGQPPYLDIRGTYTGLRTMIINLPQCAAGKKLVMGMVKTYTKWWLWLNSKSSKYFTVAVQYSILSNSLTFCQDSPLPSCSSGSPNQSKPAAK